MSLIAHAVLSVAESWASVRACEQVVLVDCVPDLHHGGVTPAVVNHAGVKEERQIRDYRLHHVEEAVASVSRIVLGWLASEEE